MIDLVGKAYSVAEKAHFSQWRKYKKEPFILHTVRVQQMVARHPNSNEQLEAAALLHDVIEDTNYISEDELRSEFGDSVYGLIMQLTNASQYPTKSTLPRRERKLMDLKKISEAHWGAKLIKLADAFDNVNGLEGAPLGYARMYAKEKVELVEVLNGTDESFENAVLDSCAHILLRGYIHR